MRNNFLIAIAMLLLFVSSCKKDETLKKTDNNQSSNTESDIVVQSSVNPTYTINKIPLDAIKDITSKITSITLETNFSLGDYIEEYGLPEWELSIIDYNEEKDKYVATIPFVKNGIITTLLFANNLQSEELILNSVNRDAFSNIAEQESTSEEDKMKWFLPMSRFLYLKEIVEGQIDYKVNTWLMNNATTNTDVVDSRCQEHTITITWVGYIIDQYGNYHATTGVETYVYYTDCGGGSVPLPTGDDDYLLNGGGGGSGNGSTITIPIEAPLYNGVAVGNFCKKSVELVIGDGMRWAFMETLAVDFVKAGNPPQVVPVSLPMTCFSSPALNANGIGFIIDETIEQVEQALGTQPANQTKIINLYKFWLKVHAIQEGYQIDYTGANCNGIIPFVGIWGEGNC